MTIGFFETKFETNAYAILMQSKDRSAQNIAFKTKGNTIRYDTSSKFI